MIVPVKTKLSLAEKFGLLSAMITRNWILWKRFKISALFAVVSTFVTLGTFFFLQMVIVPQDRYFAQYGGDFFTFILLGMAFFAYANISLSMYLGVIKNTYFSNWLEMIMSSPMGFANYFGITTVWAYITATFSISFYLLIGTVVFGAAISFPPAFWLVVVVLILATLAISGIGLISASMFLLFDVKGAIEPVSWFFSTFAGLVAGSVFPPEVFLDVFPPLYGVSRILPHTYALDAFRRLMAGAGWNTMVDGSPIIQLAILKLVIFCLILLPIGIVMFRAGMRKAEKEGKLARWGA